MNVRTVIPSLALLLALSATVGAAPSVLEVDTLSPKERLALPHLRVAVAPDRPLSLRGRPSPIVFEADGDGLLADLDLSPGCETALVPGKAVAAAIEAGTDDEDGTFRNLVFLRGDPARGEPPWRVVSLDVLRGKLGRQPVRFVDHDADGAFLTAYRDFLVHGKTAVPHPVSPVVVLGRTVWRVTYDEEARKLEAVEDGDFATRDVFPRWVDVADGLAHLNGIRSAMNLPPVALSREASRVTLLHVNYLERNGGNGHIERDDFPGYTREGAMAGLNSIGHLGGGSTRVAIDGHLGSLLHRIDLIDPRNVQIGVAATGNRIWIHTEWGEKRPWEGQGPVLPGPAGRWNSGSYSGENPDPRPGETTKVTGLPVTVCWFGADSVREVRAELGSGRGRPECWKNDADGRELSTNHSALRAVIMTRDPLRRGKYRLVLTWKQDDRPCRLEHDFRIGR